MKNKQVMNRQTSSKELHLISCGWEKCTPEQSYGPGVRRYYTIHFVLSGQGYFYMNNRKYTLKAGQCFFIPPVTFQSLDLHLDLLQRGKRSNALRTLPSYRGNSGPAAEFGSSISGNYS